MARSGGTAGRAAAAPRFRARSRKPAAALRTAAPAVPAPRRTVETGRARARLPGAGPGLRAPRWRRKFSRIGKGGWR